MADDRPALDQLLDLLVYAPIGVLAALRDGLPKLAEQGRRETQLARMIGQFAVVQGRRELDRRIAALRDRTVPGAAPEPTPSPDPAPAPAPARSTRRRTATARPESATAAAPTNPAVPAGRPVGTEPATSAPAVTDLAIADYDSLAASQVVARLDGLTPAQRGAVRGYETAHRARRTILGKISQLEAAP